VVNGIKPELALKKHVHENRGFCIDFAIFYFLETCLSVVYEKTWGGGRTPVNT
jgi:predicted choloylglycine hydrolase